MQEYDYYSFHVNMLPSSLLSSVMFTHILHIVMYMDVYAGMHACMHVCALPCHGVVSCRAEIFLKIHASCAHAYIDNRFGILREQM